MSIRSIIETQVRDFLFTCTTPDHPWWFLDYSDEQRTRWYGTAPGHHTGVQVVNRDGKWKVEYFICDTFGNNEIAFEIPTLSVEDLKATRMRVGSVVDWNLIDRIARL